MFCCGGDETKEKKGAGVAGVALGADGSYELDKDHAQYLEASKAKTAQKNYEIQKAYQNQQSSGTDEQKATARFWFEFHNKITERLENIRQIGKTDDKEGEEGEKAPDPKAEHEKFLKEINFELEEPLLKIFGAYSKGGDDGDRKINKEASMRLFDDLVNVHGDMCLTSAQDYSRYCLKFYAQQDSSLEDSKKEAADTAEKAAVKQAKTDALEKELKGAKKDNFSGLEKAIKSAEEVEADVEAAKAKLAELKEQKEKADAEAAEKKQKKADEAAKAKEAAKEKMSDEEKEKEAAEQKKKDENEATCKAKKEEAEKVLNDAVEAAGEDRSALQVAITKAEKDSNKPDTTAAKEKMAELQAAAADKTVKENARTAAEENFLLSLNNHIDTLINDWTTAYEEGSPFTIKKAAFDKFFNGENGAGAQDYELKRDYLVKLLEVGTGEGFEGFIQGLGFKVLESDCMEEVKKMNEKKEDDA